MKLTTLIHRLDELDKLNVRVLSKHDLQKLIPGQNPKTLEQSINRALHEQVLVRAARAYYVHAAAVRRAPGRILEELAQAMRPGELSYLSLESMLSEYGLISQIPLGALTVMTTGRSGTLETPFGTIEYTHTQRPMRSLLARTQAVKGRPLRLATPNTAVQDLMRVGRNTDMLDQDAINDLKD